MLLILKIFTSYTPITHTPYWAVSPHIGDMGEHRETWEGIGNDTGRNGEKWVETGRSGENNHPPPSYWPVLEKHRKIGKKREQYGRQGTTRELYGSNTAQSGITRGNTGDFSPSRTSPYRSNYPALSPCCSRSIPCCSRIDAQCF